MARNIEAIADRLGAEVTARLPEIGGGAFGAARIAEVVSELQERLQPGSGLRPGRPSDPEWEMRPKIPMSRSTYERLARLAEPHSRGKRRVSPMQLAARILEKAVEQLAVE